MSSSSGQYNVPSRPVLVSDQGQSVARGGGPPHDPNMEARVAVLEQIAKDTKDALVGLRSDLKEMRDDARAIRTEQRADYRWLLGITLGIGGGLFVLGLGLMGVMAHGFKWL